MLVRIGRPHPHPLSRYPLPSRRYQRRYSPGHLIRHGAVGASHVLLFTYLTGSCAASARYSRHAGTSRAGHPGRRVSAVP